MLHSADASSSIIVLYDTSLYGDILVRSLLNRWQYYSPVSQCETRETSLVFHQGSLRGTGTRLAEAIS